MPVKNKQRWSEIEEVGVYWCMRLTLIAHRILGRFFFRYFLYVIVSYYYITNRTARSASIDYIKRLSVFYKQHSTSSVYWQSYRHFITFAEAIMDKICAWSKQIDYSDVIIFGRKEFLETARKKKGALLLGSHLGNIEVCRALVTLNKTVKITILIHTKHANNFNRILKKASLDHASIEFLQVTNFSPATAILLQQRICQGEFVFIAGDRVPVNNSGRTTVVSFLGDPAQFAQGPFILASLLACPVFTLFCIKENGIYHMYFEHFSEQLIIPRETRDESLKIYIHRYAKRLENYCLKTPLQWFNFYFYWALPHESSD